MAKKYSVLKSLSRSCGREKVLKAILMLEAGTPKQEVAAFLKKHPSYLSNLLKELGPPVTVYRIPAFLVGLEDKGFTDDLGTVASHRPGWNAQSYQDATGKEPLNPKTMVKQTEFMETAEYQAFCLNTAERAERIAAYIESTKFEGSTNV